MTLRVAQVPDPPPGADWSDSIPGQYLERITAVQASLITQGVPESVMHDATGNGNDGAYMFFPAVVPGLVAGNDARQFGGMTSTSWAEVDFPVVNWAGSFTIELWLLPEAGTAVQAFYAQQGVLFATTGYVELVVQPDGTVNWTGTAPAFMNVFWQAGPGSFPYDGNGHHLVLTYDQPGDIVSLYVDGAAVPIGNVYGNPLDGTTIDTLFVNRRGQLPAYTPFQTFDELAVYPAVLGVGQVAAHFAAASVSFPAYAAAVLGDAPSGYWHLQDVIPASGRTPTLLVTDGHVTVGDFGSGFGPGTGTPPYAYSWVLNASSNTELADGSVVTTGIPPLLLPAGYTLGTFTPDLGGDDQWTGITVWWSDDVMLALDPLAEYLFPGGVRLRYQRVEVPA